MISRIYTLGVFVIKKLLQGLIKFINLLSSFVITFFQTAFFIIEYLIADSEKITLDQFTTPVAAK